MILPALKTLPKRQMASGMAETIKHACLASREMFEFIKENLDAAVYEFPIDLSAFPKQVYYKRSDGQMESLPLEYMNPPLEREEIEQDMLIPLYEMK